LREALAEYIVYQLLRWQASIGQTLLLRASPAQEKRVRRAAKFPID
jgi:hypothetical protein